MICLGLKSDETEVQWDEIFDLPEQSVIREDCQNLVDRLGNEEEDRLSVLCDLESVLTKYCKESGYTYSSNLKWLEVLEPLIALRLPRTQLYYYFSSIQRLYIPKNAVKNGNPFHLFRLLLLYHEPELCSLLDTKKIAPDKYAASWFSSLFSDTCCLKVTQAIWDVYFQAADPFLIFFLALVIVVNTKDQLLTMKEESQQSIIDILSSMPSELEVQDVEDFLSVAFAYMSCTPLSFTKEYYSLIFENSMDTQDGSLSQALCLPVSVKDLVKRNEDKVVTNVKFFIVDCRPADQYNSGHLSTAFHLEASLMLQEPAAFCTAVEALFAAKDQAIAASSVAAGEHICFMGSGREEEDQYVHMVIASFLQKHQRYISIAQGGYSALHHSLEGSLDSYLSDHCPKSCLICSSKPVSNGIMDKEISIMDRFATAVRTRGAVVRERLVEYITNPQVVEDRHVSSSDRLGKRYRGLPPVFSIDDDHEEGDRFTESEEDLPEEVNIQTWEKKPDVLHTFPCDELKDDGVRYPSHLLVTDIHMFILRSNPQKKGFAYIVARRPLTSIVKITSKRKCPEIITFKHGFNSDDGLIITAVDHLLIPKAGDATRLIKYQIFNINQNPPGR